MEKRIIAIWICIILILQVVMPVTSLALETTIVKPEIKQESKTETNNQVEQEYSKLYKEWLKLSDEEKKKTIEPSKYDIPLASFDLSATESLPTKYNLKDHIMIPVKDQGICGNCCAFASMTSLETNLALTTGEYYDFSEMHFTYLSAQQLGGTRETEDVLDIIFKGMRFVDFKEYVNLKRGPVFETEVPYKLYEELDYDMLKSKTAKKTVTEWADFPTVSRYTNITEAEKEQIRNKVKEHITKYGSVYADIYTNGGEWDSNVYCSQNNVFADHAISIVGWDDNYSRENFSEENRPTKDGAYIALNSWGKYNENGGYLYISYEDALVCSNMHGIIKAGDVENEVKQYEINNNKPVTISSYGGIATASTIYMKNEYKRDTQQTEYLTKISVPAIEGDSCEIYVDNKNNGELNEKLIKKVENLCGGNNIILLDSPIELSNPSFSIKVKYIARQKYIVDEEEKYRLPIYFTTNKLENDSSYSDDGVNWNPFKANESLNMYYNIVAYIGNATMQVGNMNAKNYLIKDEAQEMQIPVNINKYDSNQKEVTIKITKDGKDESGKFTVSGKEIVNNNANIKISIPEKLEKGCYIIELNYNGATRYKIINRGSAFDMEISDYWYRNDKTIKSAFYISDNDAVSGKKDFTAYIEKNGKDVTNQFTIKKIFEDDSITAFAIQYAENQELETGEYTLKIICNNTYEETAKFKVLNMFLVDEYYNNFLQTEDPNNYNVVIENTSTGEVILDGEETTDRTELQEDIYYKIKIYKNFYEQKSNYEKYYQTYVYKKDGVIYITADKSETNKTQQANLDCYLPDGTKDNTKSNKASIQVLNNNLLIKINNNMKSNKGYCTETVFRPYEIKTTTKQVLEDIASSQTVKFYDKDDKAVENETILKTGMKLEIGQEKYDVIVRGDLNGDGDVDITDLVKIKLHLIEKRKLTGAYLEAAETNGGENVTVGDMGKIILHIFGIESL